MPMWPGQKLSLMLLTQQESSEHSARSQERLGWCISVLLADVSVCVPDSPVGIDSKVKVESHQFHFRWVSWEMGWRVTILQFVLLCQHCQCVFYRDAHFPNCSRSIRSIHFGLPANKTIPSPCARESLCYIHLPKNKHYPPLPECRSTMRIKANKLSSTVWLRFEHLYCFIQTQILNHADGLCPDSMKGNTLPQHL